MPRQTATAKTSPRTTRAVHMAAASGSSDSPQATQTSGPFDREQAVREAAYACFEARGCEPGHELDDWLRAEAVVQQANGDAASSDDAAMTH